MKLAVTPYFFESVFAFDAKSKRAILSTIKALEANPKSDSLKIHKINRTKCDSSFRSARVNDEIRVIFAMRGDACTLLYVGHHDDAYAWCEGKYLERTNFGAEILYDTEAEKQLERSQAVDPFLFSTAPALLGVYGIRKKDLGKLGIPEIHAERLVQINDEDTFLDYIQVFPEELQEALLNLETGEKTIDVVYNELVDEQFQRGEVAEHRDTKRRFHLLQSLEELERLLEGDDFERWAVFLHPEQEKLVTRNFRGPALIEGGPGTGKTILGIHRAVYLASNVFREEDSKRILICTFSKKLAKSITTKLDLLKQLKGIKAKNIDVLGVDQYIRSMYFQAYHQSPQLGDAHIRSLLRECYGKLRPKGSLAFYEYEYREVVERNHIETLTDYLAVDRSGSGLALNQKQRALAWEFLGAFLKEKQDQQLISFVDLAHLTLNALHEGRIKRVYDSIIIDEAQDLEAVKLRVIAESAIASSNNLMILSDLNQRVFKLTSWKKDSRINVVGRTHYLSINYRTTKQISDYARNQFVNSEMVTAHIREYKSIVNGRPPVIEGFRSDHEQIKFIVAAIRERLDTCAPEHICVVCPSVNDCNTIKSILMYEGIANSLLEGDTIPEAGIGVCVCPITGVKGLEFKIVIIYNYNGISHVPWGAADELRKKYMKLSECAKYVAATRARDELIITYISKEE